MRLIGLTGGIGMGKSTVAEYLAEAGEKLIDSDVLARELVQPGQVALGEIREAFGGAMVDAEGHLDRKSLASVVFSDESARRRLEGILHPRIRAAWQEQAERWRASGEERAFVVIPLLYETGADREVDRVLCVACTPETQRQRLKSRGWADDEIRKRHAAQLPVEKKMDRADGVIWNESTVAVCHEQCRRWLVSDSNENPLNVS